MKKRITLVFIQLIIVAFCAAQTIITNKDTLATTVYASDNSSDIRSFNVSAVDGISSIPMIIVPTSNIEVSLYENEGFAPILSLETEEDYTIATTTIYAKYINGLAIGTYNDTIVIAFQNDVKKISFKAEVKTPGIPTNTSPKDETHISVYPNPSKGAFMINNLSGTSNIIISDISGKNISNYYTSQDKLQLDLSDQNDGLYLLTISNETSHQTLQLLKN